jgi:hypothetical protein
LTADNPRSAELLKSIDPQKLAGLIIRHTTKTKLPEEDDNYDSDEDDFDDQVGSLPKPTDTATVKGLVRNRAEQDVVLWRGASPSMAQAIISNQSAGGATANADTTAVGEDTRKAQIGFGGMAPEFTSNPELQGFSRDNWLVVVRINTKFLAQGSGSEDGWIAPHDAPLEVLAAVDRTRNKAPNAKPNAS